MQAELESPDSFARNTIIHALNRNPYEVWTRESLASHFGISPTTVGRILSELLGAGIVQRLPGPDDEYTTAGAGY